MWGQSSLALFLASLLISFWLVPVRYGQASPALPESARVIPTDTENVADAAGAKLKEGK